jgi:dephospho-CoA kinase
MIIGLTGSYGAGKGSVADYLVHQKGFTHFSARQFIQAEALRRGLDIERGREVTIPIGNELRERYGPAYIIEQLMQQARANGGDVVIESLRAVGEVTYIQTNGGFVLGVDADPQVRYERIVQRASETDHVTFEEWKAQELAEMNPDDPTKQDIFGALKQSDYIIMNTHTLTELEAAVDVFLETHHD